MSSTLAIAMGGIGLATVCLTVGVAVGRHLGRRSVERFSQARELRRLTARLYRLVSRVAGDVGEHHTQIEQVTRELGSMQLAREAPLAGAFLETVAQTMRINQRLQERLARAEERLQRQARQIESHVSEARTDALTGLPNRRAFDDELVRRLAEWTRKRTEFSLIMVDVDHFKPLNDRYGHAAGDEVLRELSRVLRQGFREMDLVARFGGEEFAVILPDTGLDDARWPAERVRVAVAGTEFAAGGRKLRLTASLGLATVVAGDEPASLVQRADEALYAAKHQGRNCAYYHTGQVCKPVDLPRADQPPFDAWDVVCSDLRTRLTQVVDDA